MSRFNSINKISIYEVNGIEINQSVSDGNKPVITVSEHWNERKKVVIEFKNDKYTVIAEELIRAIENAENAHVQD